MVNNLFETELQFKILVLLCRDKNFVSRNVSQLKAHYFENMAFMDISRLVIEFFYKYKTIPDLTILSQEIQQFLEKHDRPEPANYFVVLKSIYSTPLSNMEYVKDKVIEFITAQAYKKAFEDGLEALEQGQYDKINKAFSSANKAGQKFSQGMFYFEESEIDKRWENDTGTRIPTGIQKLDGILDGGIEPGELGIFLAPTNVGKSLFLNIIGVGALKLRKHVAHYSHEMKKKKVARRYDRCLLKKSFMAIKDDEKGNKAFLMRWIQNIKSNLYIQDFPTKSATIQDLKNETEFLHGQGFYPDVVLDDYAALVKSLVVGEKHEQIEDICEGLRGMGAESEMNHATWTVAQTKSEALKKAIVDLDDIGKSFAQVQVADVVVCICQTKDEYEEGKLRLFVGKNRDGKKHQILPYKIDYETLSLRYNP